MQMTLEGKLTLNAPRMESSKNWMLCWVSALHSFLHRKHKQEVKPSPERSATHQSHQELGDLLFFFYCSSGFETSCSSCSTSHHGLALHSQCFLGVGILGRQLGLYTQASLCSSLQQHQLLQLTAPFVNLHCSRMLPWQGRILSILNAIFFCKSLMFSRNTRKIKYLWGWKICQGCRTVITEKTQFLLCKCPVSSFLMWFIIHMMKHHEPFVFSVFN